MKKILFLLACLWTSCSLSVIPGPILVLSGAKLGTFAIAQQDILKNIEPLVFEDEVKVRSRLQNLHDKGLLRFKPVNINLSYGPGFGTVATIKPILHVKKGADLDEFTALHEAKHINGMHSLTDALIFPAVACIAFRKGWTPSIFRNILRIGGVGVLSKSTRFFKGKHDEKVADTHAAENCSDSNAFKGAIREFRDDEDAMVRYLQYKCNADKEVVKTALYLTDPHLPLTENRADRLKRIYDRRVADGSLVEQSESWYKTLYNSLTSKK